MNGAEYIAEFLRQRGSDKVFLLTGGACAFVVDAIARNPGIDYFCFQHEQAAAIAADAVWRINGKVGVTLATSGPGATNLLTGIACSYFDSIPAIHITGQVNQIEKKEYLNAKVRQGGFQETNIVDMAKPVTKYAVKVDTIEQLKYELTKAYNIAISGRMGSVLIDVPMDVQKADAGENILYEPPEIESPLLDKEIQKIQEQIQNNFEMSSRPAVLIGGGIGLAGVNKEIMTWIQENKLPFGSSWHGLSYFDQTSSTYLGSVGVYGNRGANALLQNCDYLLVLGSRLDSRQRSGNAKNFAPNAKVQVIDIDIEELNKYISNKYQTNLLDLKQLPRVLKDMKSIKQNQNWLAYVSEIREKYFNKNISTFAVKQKTLSPYEVIEKINKLIPSEAIVTVDCGGSQCWVHQAFRRTTQTFFTSGGMAPMGYSLPAAIGASLTAPNRQVFAFTGDGGLQVNIQELQTLMHYKLNIKIIIMNNNGYGIIKQFQDSYFEGRYEATGRGVSNVNFEALSLAYKLSYTRVEKINQLDASVLNKAGPGIIECVFHENTLIEPKVEMGLPINDQFPYVSDEEFSWANRFSNIERSISSKSPKN